MFSNAAALFGRRISPEELYTYIVDMPTDGVLFIDEASAAAESGMGGRVAIAALSSSLLNNRKQNVQVLYATAQDHQIAFPFGTGLGRPPSVSVSGPSFAGGLWDAFSGFTPYTPARAPLFPGRQPRLQKGFAAADLRSFCLQSSATSTRLASAWRRALASAVWARKNGQFVEKRYPDKQTKCRPNSVNQHLPERCEVPSVLHRSTE